MPKHSVLWLEWGLQSGLCRRLYSTIYEHQFVHHVIASEANMAMIGNDVNTSKLLCDTDSLHS